ncbi:unnamed protein product [Symbiodinium necroappetens]|uniref:Uncharacterized protein n=1 Tax=Symbiodinium necroappetens TaxID=1628268 RepID=A0A812ZVY9_9DINO|nr:unnamed protein product [Symbiodinium necroappetens]
MIHVPALPGTPASDLSPGAIVSEIEDQARLYEQLGFDAVMIENMHDTPYLRRNVGPEITAMMAVCARAATETVDIPVGVQILAGANRAALAAAHAGGASFVRAEGFAFASVADEGLLDEADAGPLLRHRAAIGAEDILIFADIKKKHSSHAITADLDLAETAKACAFMRADGLIITGSATGEETSTEDLQQVAHVTDLPILVGSGAHEGNIKRMLELATGVIVGAAQGRGTMTEPPTPPPPDDLPDRDITLNLPEPFGAPDNGDIITIVTGLPRSGTSLMMQMLEAGGIPPCTDNKRTADVNNARGYYEHAKVMALRKDATWVPEAAGGALKVVAPLLEHLPEGPRYRVIFMERDLASVMQSQATMLERLGRAGGAATGAEALRVSMRRHLLRADRTVREREDMRALHIPYEALLENPTPHLERLARFLGDAFDAAAASRVIVLTMPATRNARLNPPTRRRHLGVTLVELIITLGVLLVLLGILAPTLRGARDEAVELTGLSDIKQNAALVHTYASENDLYFPIGTDEDAHPTTVTGSWWRVVVKTGVLSYEEYQQWGDRIAKLSMTAATDPRHLIRGQTVDPFLALKHIKIRTSQVRSPSAWGMLNYPDYVDPSGYAFRWCCNDLLPSPVAFGDGSAGMYIWHELLPDGELYIENNIGYPVNTAWGGIHGRSR